ncbi:NADPH-dependent FMN reductase [Rubrolithibacter danxiaensis]|uniref:NADPH-dependent FMN reductase n=1 Tax=Rubrolithibacter danxiaensis TaxID=3390805 RepID=UPI003BF80425
MITIVSATNRENSYTLKLAEYYRKQLRIKGVEAEILSLTSLPEGLIHPEMYMKSRENFQPMQNIVTATDKFLFIIPEYNGSFPGVLKVFIDACKYPESFHGKKAALVGISSGKYGNIRGIDHFTGICHYINLHVMPLRLHIPSINKEFNEEGNLFKEDTLKFTTQQIDQFVVF